MDKRKAYAITHPLRQGAPARDGHRRRVDHRFQTTLFCDGEWWIARVEYLDYNFKPFALETMLPEQRERLAEAARRLLVSADCGDGSISVAELGSVTVEARRAMMPSEQAAIRGIERAAG